ncbi:MAG: hypothetical protein F6K54_11390 [Okeania sp. SIO3B5]|uniref:hypothetical protein n=1 Tax=Okeania sp. SIO3B5 TaxID=2607811 RepID=UPI00140058E0|nr:hypothetical protein [Okeania sp. SIO3B5]NEO53630.1 hypothetical protein [Okeania sp. SIO3B5]
MKKLLATSFLAVGMIVFGSNTAYGMTCREAISVAMRQISSKQKAFFWAQSSQLGGPAFREKHELNLAIQFGERVLNSNCGRLAYQTNLPPMIESAKYTLGNVRKPASFHQPEPIITPIPAPR